MNIKLIKQKDFSLLMFGKLVSLLGSNMQQFALSLYVLAMTGSATIFASMLSISILPRLLLSPVAGVFGDWFDRKKSIVSLDFINSIIIGVFALIYIINGRLSLSMVYVFVILLEITEIFFHSAMSAVMPSLVEKEDIADANAINSLVMNIGQLLAPVIASIIYGSFGLKSILILNSASFFLSAVSEMFICIPKKHKKPDKINLESFKTDFKEGIIIIKENKLISTIISLGTVINFCVAPLFSIGLVFIIKEVLKATDFQYGLFETVLASSMITAPLICSAYLKKIEIGRMFYRSFISIAVLIFMMSIVPSKIITSISFSNMLPFALLTVISFLIGAFATIANIALGTMFNQIVPIHLMGRTSTVFNLLVTVFIPIGQMIFGYLYDIIAPSYVIAISAIILAVALKKFKFSLIEIDKKENDKIGDAVNEV